MEGQSPGTKDIGVTPPPSDTDTGVRADISSEFSSPILATDLHLPDTESKRITAEDVEKSKAEKEAAMSKLMDDMEASVETQGQYFIRLGDKIPLTQTQQETRSRILGLGKRTTERQVEVGLDDQRVLVLNALEDGRYRDRGQRYVETTMITRDGIKTVRTTEILGHAGDFGPDYDAIRKLQTGSKPAEGTGFNISESGVKQIKLGYMNEAGEPTDTAFQVSDYNGAVPFSGTREEFQDRVKKSIDQTESPHKAIVEKNTAGIQLAHSAAGFIQSLPPRA